MTLFKTELREVAMMAQQVLIKLAIYIDRQHFVLSFSTWQQKTIATILMWLLRLLKRHDDHPFSLSLSLSLSAVLYASYLSSHYKNEPNDLQLMSDAPGQKLYVLLGPDATAQSAAGGIPDVLCVLQVAMEGQISKESVDGILSRGQRASGDLIPWTVSQQFQDSEFAGLSGARVVRIATHHDVSSMGYGSRALELLTRYFSGEMTSLNVDDDSGGEDEEKGNEDDAEDATDDEEDDEVGPLSLSLSLSPTNFSKS
jgi:hypothetical protein